MKVSDTEFQYFQFFVICDPIRIIIAAVGMPNVEKESNTVQSYDY